jgi:hypothetical protein
MHRLQTEPLPLGHALARSFENPRPAQLVDLRIMLGSGQES